MYMTTSIFDLQCWPQQIFQAGIQWARLLCRPGAACPLSFIVFPIFLFDDLKVASKSGWKSYPSCWVTAQAPGPPRGSQGTFLSTGLVSLHPIRSWNLTNSVLLFISTLWNSERVCFVTHWGTLCGAVNDLTSFTGCFPELFCFSEKECGGCFSEVLKIIGQ